MCTGSGIPPTMIDRVVGVAKAYTTRVGEGPMPSEDTVVGDLLHGMGREYGATTGRERRCGWFDAVTVRQAVMVNGITDLAVTNFDGLDTLPEVKVRRVPGWQQAVRPSANRFRCPGKVQTGV